MHFTDEVYLGSTGERAIDDVRFICNTQSHNTNLHLKSLSKYPTSLVLDIKHVNTELTQSKSKMH